jgi:hypothetical protein
MAGRALRLIDFLARTDIVTGQRRTSLNDRDKACG